MDTKLKLRLLKLLFKPSKYPINSNQKTEAGFNLLDVAIVVIIVGILSAIAAPAWDAFVNRQRLRAAQNTVFQAMQSAQAAARGNRSSWQVSFKTEEDDDGNDRVYVALHSTNLIPTTPRPQNFDELPTVGEASGITEGAWYPLAKGIQIDENENYTNNLVQVTDENDPEDVESYTQGNIYRILFNYNGCPTYADGQECTQSDELNFDETNPIALTLVHKQLREAKRCVLVKTIIGSMSTADGDNCDQS